MSLFYMLNWDVLKYTPDCVCKDNPLLPYLKRPIVVIRQHIFAVRQHIVRVYMKSF